MRRRATYLFGATAIVLSLGLNACGTDDPDESSSSRGGGKSSGETSVENVFIVPAYTENCAIQVDGPAELKFTATNNSSTETETLAGISTPIAETVEIDATEATRTIGPGETIAGGQPVENLDAPRAPDEPFPVMLIGLDESAAPGVSVPVSFTFQRAGEITLEVGIDACPTQAN